MARLCYLCNKETHVWHQNLLQLKLQHSNISICTFFKKFLRNLESHRNVENQLNCICEECYDEIQVYDAMRMMVVQKENALRDLLLATEQSFARSDELETEIKMEIIEMDTAAAAMDYEPKIVLQETDVKPIRQPNKSDGVHKRKQQTSKSKNVVIVPLCEKESGRVKHFQETVQPIVLKVECNVDANSESALKQELMESENESESADPIDQSDQTISAANVDEDADFSPLSSENGDEDGDEEKDKNRADGTRSLISILESNDYTIVDAMGLPLDPDKMPIVSKKKLNAILVECGICGDVMQRLKFNVHKRWHDRHPGFTCRFCKYKSSDKESLASHQKLHENRSRLECVLCGKRFSERPALAIHMKIHIGERNKMCEICGKAFLTVTVLRTHMNIHTKERQYECTRCSKLFGASGNLKKHMKIHSNERPYACSFCDLKFKIKGHCTVHERRHTEDTKTQKCTLCSAAFEHKLHLKQHIERRHQATVPSGSKIMFDVE